LRDDDALMRVQPKRVAQRIFIEEAACNGNEACRQRRKSGIRATVACSCGLAQELLRERSELPASRRNGLARFVLSPTFVATLIHSGVTK
jgi:hypothetical protein